MSDLVSTIAALLYADFAAEAGAGFPTVRRIPSTEAVKFLDYFAALESGGRGPLLNGMARLGAFQFFPPALVHQQALEVGANDAALAEYRAALQSGHFAYGLRYVEPRMAKAMLSDPQGIAHMAQTRAALKFRPRDDPPHELAPEPDIRKLQPAKAPLLRKLIQASFAGLFSAKKSTLPGGETRYAGSLGATPIEVAIDFASRLAQLRWSITMPMRNPNLKGFRLEDFWGRTGWDYLTEENAARSIDLLGERIAYFVNLKERIDALPAAAEG